MCTVGSTRTVTIIDGLTHIDLATIFDVLALYMLETCCLVEDLPHFPLGRVPPTVNLGFPEVWGYGGVFGGTGRVNPRI